MKTSAITLAASAVLLASSAQAQSALNMLDEGRNMSVLNAQTFDPSEPYIVPPAPEDATQFAFELKGYVFGLRLVRANYLGYVGDDSYAAYTDLKTSGLGALLKKLEIWAVARGRVSPTGALRPIFHVQQNTDKKNRRVEMTYDDTPGTIDVQIVPPLGSQGVPAATHRERYNAYDTITALLHMTRKGQQDADALCTGSVPIFDSKQHYNLRLEPVGTDRVKFLDGKQEAIHCHAYYEPVSGFDPEDLPDAEEAGTPVDVYFKYFADVDMHVPVRFAYKISSITAVIKVDTLTFVTPDGEVIREG